MSFVSRRRLLSSPACSFTVLVALAAASAVPSLAQAPAAVAQNGFMAPAGSNVVTVVTHEYAFTMADTLPAGLTTFRLDDEGKELHHITLVKLDSGKTIVDLVGAMKAEGAPPPAWMRFIGGPNTPEPGQISNATVELTPGYYVALCMIPDPTGVPHFARGMMHPFIVLASGKASAPLPEADITATLSDYAFTWSKPLTAGRHVIAVTNTSSQPHEMVISRFAPGKGNKDFTAWAYKPEGKPWPAYAMGGVTAIPPGATVVFEQTFTPGRYGVICFIPDAKDGKPHFMHGMEQELDIK